MHRKNRPALAVDGLEPRQLLSTVHAPRGAHVSTLALAARPPVLTGSILVTSSPDATVGESIGGGGTVSPTFGPMVVSRISTEGLMTVPGKKVTENLVLAPPSSDLTSGPVLILDVTGTVSRRNPSQIAVRVHVDARSANLPPGFFREAGTGTITINSMQANGLGTSTLTFTLRPTAK